MTGKKLKGILFKEGVKGEQMADFAKWANYERQMVPSFFNARTVKPEILRKYAEWKGKDVAEFLLWATGPAPDYAAEAQPNAVVVAEPNGDYGKTDENQADKKGKVPIIDPNQNEIVMPMHVIMKILENQENQIINDRIRARADELNALTIAHLSGLSDAEIAKRQVG